MSVTWKGSRFDVRTRDMLVEAERLWGLPLVPSQGSYSSSVGASAGTHSGCGAVDVIVKDNSPAEQAALVAVMRRVGFAAWLRTPGQGFVLHVHGIAVQPLGKWDRSCLHTSAHSQVIDYYEGLNGLASRAPDDGPRDWVGTTWETYQQGKDDDDQEVPDMRMIEAPKRGVALFGPGYWRVLANPEQRDTLLGQGIPLWRGNERQWDVTRACMVQGSMTDRVESALDS